MSDERRAVSDQRSAFRCQALGVEDKTERDERVYEAVRVYGYTLKEVADASGLHSSTVSVIVKRVAGASKHQN